MKKVVVYPGRFQPMLSHHAKVYDELQRQFPDAEVYISTSDKVEGDKSPFNFQEKQKIAQAHGIDPNRVLQSKSPYNAQSYDFDADNTVLIFAVGEKDMNRFPFDNVDPETGLQMTKRGEPRPAYTQHIDALKADPQPMSKHGYITLAPTIKTGDEIASASAFRDSLQNAPDEESAKKLYTQQFGEYNDNVFNLIYDKIVRNKMKEDLNTLRQLAGLDPMAEGAPVDFKPGYAMDDNDRKLADIGRLIMDMANQRPMGKGTPDSELELQNKMSELGGGLADGSIKDPAGLISFIKGVGDQAAELSNVVKQAMADYAEGKKADVKGEEPAEEPEAEEEFEGVDLSDFYSDQEEVTEGAGDLNELLGRFERECVEDYRYYGDVDAAKVQQHLDRGDMEGAAEEMAGSMTDQDGGSDNFDAIYDVAKDMIDDHMHTAEAIEDHVCPECDGSGCEACDDVGGDISEGAGELSQEGFNACHSVYTKALELGGDPNDSNWDDMLYDAADSYGLDYEEIPLDDWEEYDYMQRKNKSAFRDMLSNFKELPIEQLDQAVSETAENAMSAALAELRKLAGL